MTGTVSIVTICVHLAQTVQLSPVPVVRSPDESRLLDFLAAARNSNGNLQRKTIAKCVRQHKRGILGAVGHCWEFGPVLVHRAKMEEKDIIDKMGVHDVVPSPMLRREDVVSFAPGGSLSTQGQVTISRYVPGGSLKNSVVVVLTNTSTSQRHPILRWSKP